MITALLKIVGGWVAMFSLNPKCKSKEREYNKGFTMVELIVVIVIILVLAAVLVPSLLRYIGKSQEAVCRQNRASLYTEISSAFAIGDYDSLEDAFDGLYSEDRKDFCPTGGYYVFDPNIDEFGDIFSGEILCSEHDGKNGTDKFIGRDAASHLKLSKRLGIDTNVDDKRKADKDLNAAFETKYKGTYPSLTTKEKALFDNVSDNIKNTLSESERNSLTWEPRVASNGDVLMIARNRNKGWQTYMVYYNGNYYYHTNGYFNQDSASITDNGTFDVNELTKESEPQKGTWVQVD